MGRRVRRTAALPRSQPGPVQVAATRRARRRSAVVWSLAGGGRLPRHSTDQRRDRRPTDTTPRRRAARHCDRAGRGGVRHGDRRSGPAGPAAAVRRFEGLRTIVVSGRRLVGRRARHRGSRTTPASPQACRATSLRAERSSRRADWAPRSSSPGRSRGSMPRRVRYTWTGDVLSARTIILACGVSGGGSRSRGSTARRQGNLLRCGTQRSSEHPRSGHPRHWGRKLGGAGRDVLPRSHARR